MIPVAKLLETLEKTTNVHTVVKKTRCSQCGSKGTTDFRIVYVIPSGDVMLGKK